MHIFLDPPAEAPRKTYVLHSTMQYILGRNAKTNSEKDQFGTPPHQKNRRFFLTSGFVKRV